MKYFKQFPVAEYYFEKKDEKFLFKNFFLKVELLEYLKNNPKVLSNYVLKTDETPDQLAYRLYGNSNLHWTILLVNDVLDGKDWVMSNSQLNEYCKQRYLNKDAAFYTTRNGVQESIESNRFMVEKNPFGTVDSDPDPSLTDPMTYDTITYYQYETLKNDSKRIVQAIKKEYMPAFLTDFERKIKTIEGT